MLQGRLHPDFAGVAVSLARIMPRKGPGGAAVCVYHRGEKVVDVWGGTRDAEGSPWQADTVAVCFSTTKGVASTLLHVLADRGLVDYDTPVAHYWPEFAQNGKESITVRHVMCHEAGLYAIADMVDHAREMLDWDTMVEKLAAATPRHAPGEDHGYHALTYGWLVGEIARRVTGGKPFPELLATELAAPLGLEGLYCGVPEHEQHRCAELMAAGMGAPPEQQRERMRKFRERAKRIDRLLSALGVAYDPQESLDALVPPGMEDLEFNDAPARGASIPAANGMFTARSLARLYACLAGGGELDGVRLVSRETIARASEEQNRGIGRVVPISMRWRLGYHRVFAFGARVPGGFGHFGFGGSGAWADPSRELSVAMVCNRGTGTPVGDVRLMRLSKVAIESADRATLTAALTVR